MHAPREPEVAIQLNDLSLRYGSGKLAISGITMPIHRNKITIVIGPSACGKTSILRCLHPKPELMQDIRASGEVVLYPEGINILHPSVDHVSVRMRMGVVFQKPISLGRTIYKDCAAGLYLRGINAKSEIDGRIEVALRRAHLWDVVRDRLQASPNSLSGGEQQRLCIARAIAYEPEIFLLDEPAASLDPIASAKVGEVIRELKSFCTVLMITHKMEQARGMADYIAFICIDDLNKRTDGDQPGKLNEFNTCDEMTLCPRDERTRGFMSGKFG